MSDVSAQPQPQPQRQRPSPASGFDASRDHALGAARAAAAKLGTDTLILGVGDVLGIVDWFVITSAANARQVRTIAEEVEAALKRGAQVAPIRVEGLDDARWVLLDYGDIVVHVFLDEARAYYELERLWSDVPRLDWTTAASAYPM